MTSLLSEKFTCTISIHNVVGIIVFVLDTAHQPSHVAAVLASSASKKGAVTPCTRNICGMEIIAIHPRAFVVDLFVDLRQGLIFRKIYKSKVHFTYQLITIRERHKGSGLKHFYPLKWFGFIMDHFLLKKALLLNIYLFIYLLSFKYEKCHIYPVAYLSWCPWLVTITQTQKEEGHKCTWKASEKQRQNITG